MWETTKALRDLLFTVGRTVPTDQWLPLLYKSPVVRSVLMSGETMAFMKDMSFHSHQFRERLAQALFNQQLITEAEKEGLGIVQLGQRLADHLRTISESKEAQS